jgi:hypothetical protein
MLTGLVAADVRPDRRYWWRVTLLGRFDRSVAGSLGAAYVNQVIDSSPECAGVV